MLAPCPSCSRHIRTSESACPFCSATVSQLKRSVPASPRRLERLAAFTFAATLAVTGCALTGEEEDTGQQEGEVNLMPMYGMPPPPTDAGTKDASKDATAKDAGTPCTGKLDPGAFFPMYGMPPEPEDASVFAPEPCPPSGDDGGVFPMYGMPAD